MQIYKLFSTYIMIVYFSMALNQGVIAAEYDQASELKTLFTTPVERQRLDNRREAGEFENNQQESSGPLIRLKPLKVEVKGVMFREKGNPVVWVNEGSTLKSKRINDDIRVRTKYVKQKNLKVPVKVNNKSLRMKPGQVWLETDGKVKDIYQIEVSKMVPKNAEIDDTLEDNNKTNPIGQAKAINKVIKDSNLLNRGG